MKIRIAIGLVALVLSAVLALPIWWYVLIIIGRTKAGYFATSITPYSVVYFYGTVLVATSFLISTQKYRSERLRRIAIIILWFILAAFLIFYLLHVFGRVHHTPMLEWLTMEWESF
jgi:hypothetical protein